MVCEEYTVLTVGQSVTLHPLTRFLSSLCGDPLNFCELSKINLEPLFEVICSCTPASGYSRSGVQVQSSKVWRAGRTGGRHGNVRKFTVFESKRWHTGWKFGWGEACKKIIPLMQDCLCSLFNIIFSLGPFLNLLLALVKLFLFFLFYT